MPVLSTLVLVSTAVLAFDEMAQLASVMGKLEAAPESETLGVELGKYQTCPGAANAVANIHTMAQMKVTFENSCSEVAAEVEARAGGANGWTDPHNDGHYSVVASSSSLITTQRTTRRGRYTDKQTFALSPTSAGGCVADICSESQGTSANDGGTNLCDMFDLFCNSSEKNPTNGVACKPVKTDLKYTINDEQCGRYVFGNIYAGHQCQNALTTCLKVESNLHAEALQAAGEPPKHELQVVLGKYRSCPGSEYSVFNIHTMAQMQVDFTNSCAEVAGEIEARAGMANGWQDPHNGGHYALLSANADMIETKRTTKRGRYTDKQTFSLQANGSGCTAYMCSESQGTSANDGGTNLCDMYDLFCNTSEKNPQTGVTCKPVKTNLQYTINSEECGRYVGNTYLGHQCQQANPTCLKTATMRNSLEAPQRASF
jgi:hypothetical protein